MSPDTLNTNFAPIISAFASSLLPAGVVAAAAWLYLRLGPRHNPATKHAIWWLVLIAVIALPFAPFAISAAERAATQRVAAPVARVESLPHAESPVIGVPPVAQPAEPPAEDAPRLPFTVTVGKLPLFLVALWVTLFGVQLSRVFSSYLYLRRVKSGCALPTNELRTRFDEWMLGCGVCRPAQLLISERIQSPIAVGFRRPAVILPQPLAEQLSARDLNHLQLHELAHLARYDDWTNLLARLLAGAATLHPVALWIIRRIDAERELACDDWVVEMTGASKPYAASLARFVEFRLAQRREILATGISGRKSDFRNRIERLLRPNRPYGSRTSATKVGMSFAALALLVVISAQTPQWVAFAQEGAPQIAAVPPQAPVSPARPAPPAMPPPAAVPAERILSAPPAPPLAGSPPMPASPPARPSLFAYAFQASPPAPPRRIEGSENTGSLLSALTAAGYKDLPVDQIIDLKVNGVDGQYLVAMNNAGWGKLSTQQLIKLKHHGVSPSYLKALAEVGLKTVSYQEVIDLSVHGVRPELVREIVSLGFGPYSAQQFIELSTHGARPELFRGLKDAGFQSANPKEIVEALTHGVTAKDLREARQYGAKLTLQQIIRMKSAGVL